MVDIINIFTGFAMLLGGLLLLYMGAYNIMRGKLLYKKYLNPFNSTWLSREEHPTLFYIAIILLFVGGISVIVRALIFLYST